MASIDSLPADQRAVLELVLRRGRSYDEIAQLLVIDRAGVRRRALSALDALGPETQVPAERRALITDYLLGQLPAALREETVARLAEFPAERAWARVAAGELASVASDPLPEIPVDGAAVAAGRDGRDAPHERPRQPDRPPAPIMSYQSRPSSRLGGAVVLGVVALIIVGTVIFFVVLGSSGKSAKHTTSAARRHPGTSVASTTPTALAQVTLTSPDPSVKAVGLAIVVRQAGNLGFVLEAEKVPANNHDFYAMWLYNSPTSNVLLGFVSTAVTSNGILKTLGVLPSNASKFHQILLTRETKTHPTSPGQVVIEGRLNLPS